MIDNWWRVIRIPGQGYGQVSPEEWNGWPEQTRGFVEVVALCDAYEAATATLEQLPREWTGREEQIFRDGEWWRPTGVTAPSPSGEEVELFLPADKPLPVIEMPQGEIDTLLGKPLVLDAAGTLKPIPLALLGAPR